MTGSSLTRIFKQPREVREMNQILYPSPKRKVALVSSLFLCCLYVRVLFLSVQCPCGSFISPLSLHFSFFPGVISFYSQSKFLLLLHFVALETLFALAVFSLVCEDREQKILRNFAFESASNWKCRNEFIVFSPLSLKLWYFLSFCKLVTRWFVATMFSFVYPII